MTNIEQYRYPNLHPDPQIREYLMKSFNSARGYYPAGSADAVLHLECVYLCAETADYIYSEKFTPKTTAYAPGSRPFLENIVRRIVAGFDDPLKKACRIMDFVRDNFYHEPRLCYNDMLFYGGTEEDIILKRTGMCNEIARVGCILAQIAGLPSRQCGHEGENVGHGTLEICVAGKWGWFDVRGQTFIGKDGKVASLWELMQDFDEILPLQPEWLKARCLGRRLNKSDEGRYTHVSARAMFKAAHSFIANYDVAMAARLNFTWHWEKKSLNGFMKPDSSCWTYQPDDFGFQLDDIPGY